MSQSMEPATIPDFNQQSVEVLKEHCSLLPLAITGTKAEIVSRLMNHYNLQAELKLEALLRTTGNAGDDPDGSRKEQEIRNMFEMVASTKRQKQEALQTERKQKTTVKRLFDVVQGGIGSHGVDIDGTGTDQDESTEDKINRMYEAIGVMDNDEPVIGDIGGLEGKYEEFSMSEEADAIAKKYLNEELEEYAKADAACVGDAEFQKLGDAWEVSRFNYRSRIREERTIEAKDQAQKVAADTQLEAEHAIKSTQLAIAINTAMSNEKKAELAAQAPQLDAEFEAAWKEAGLTTQENQDIEGNRSINSADLELSPEPDLPDSVEEVIPILEEPIEEAVGEKYNELYTPVETQIGKFMENKDDEIYLPFEELIEEAIEDPNDGDYEPATKKKGTRGRAFDKKKRTPKKVPSKKKKPNKKNF